jgi:hypothetical protein
MIRQVSYRIGDEYPIVVANDGRGGNCAWISAEEGKHSVCIRPEAIDELIEALNEMRTVLEGCTNPAPRAPRSPPHAIERAIVAAIEGGLPLGLAEIVQNSGMAGSSIKPALRRMVKKGQLVEIGGRYSLPAREQARAAE